MADRKKILIVDDEPDLVQWLTVFFEENGFETITAFDGAEGFAIAESEHPDVISLDISMPEESGVKMYRKLHESKTTTDIPVIILTGVSSEMERFIKTRKQVPPPAAYFEKPVDKEKLLSKVKELTA
jgi:DNA-binding response OmpR family regulator